MNVRDEVKREMGRDPLIWLSFSPPTEVPEDALTIFSKVRKNTTISLFFGEKDLSVVGAQRRGFFLERKREWEIIFVGGEGGLFFLQAVE